MKRVALKSRSKKRAKLMREVRGPLVAEILAERPWCERCVVMAIGAYRDTSAGPVQRSTQVHEIITRARGGDITDKGNCVALCGTCHSAIHAHPEVATKAGWLARNEERSAEVMPRRYE